MLKNQLNISVMLRKLSNVSQKFSNYNIHSFPRAIFFRRGTACISSVVIPLSEINFSWEKEHYFDIILFVFVIRTHTVGFRASNSNKECTIVLFFNSEPFYLFISILSKDSVSIISLIYSLKKSHVRIRTN